MKVFYNDNYTASPEAFETTRKSALIADRISNSELGAKIVDPSSIIDVSSVHNIMEMLHDTEYMDALKTGKDRGLSMSSGFQWGETTFDFAAAHSHGCVASMHVAITSGHRSGTLSSGLHHASPSGGAGFCTVNGLAVASAYASQYGRKVMILDFDAHCGGGTFAHIANMQKKGIIQKGDVVQIDMSVSGFDMYKSTSPHYLDLHHADAEDEYIDRIILALSAAETRYEDGMVVLYNAGIDPVNTSDFDDPFSLIERREQLVSSWIADKPACFTLAGGYKWGGFVADDITDMHKINIDIWATEHARMVVGA